MTPSYIILLKIREHFYTIYESSITKSLILQKLESPNYPMAVIEVVNFHKPTVPYFVRFSEIPMEHLV